LSDIFREVDEEVRREQLMKLWQRYGALIIAVCVVVIAAVGGWRAYEWWEGKKAAEWGSVFQNAATLSAEGNTKDAEEAFAKIAADAPSGYRVLARFRAAAELSQDKPADAVKAYDELAADGSLNQTLKDLGAVRAAMLLVDTAPLAEMEKRLAPLTEPGRTFRASARELLALSAWHNKDVTAARKYLDMMAADAETPAGARARAEVLSALIAGGKS